MGAHTPHTFSSTLGWGLLRLARGQTYIVSVNVESREFNGRWYTDVRAWRVQPKQADVASAADATDMPPFDVEPSYGATAATSTSAVPPVAPMNEVDDLPF